MCFAKGALATTNTVNASAQQNLITYLNDHLAGSVAALGLVGELKRRDLRPELSPELATLQAQLEFDQRVVQEMLVRAGGEVDQLKSATAWFAEKLSRLKLSLVKPEEASLAAFEALEVLTLGIEGKRLMWVALSELGLEELLAAGQDFAALELSAQEQQQRVQRWRLAACQDAFSPDAPALTKTGNASP